MRGYIIRRLFLLIPTVVLVSLIIFFLMRLLPGNIVDLMMAEGGGGDIGDKTRAELQHEMGMDVPLIVQYGRWVGIAPQADGSFSGILQGNLADSWRLKRSVIELVAKKWPVTFELGLMALIIAQLIALPVGIFSALRQDKWADYIGRSFAILCISIPGFWLGTMVVLFPAMWWDYMPSIMLIPFTEDLAGNLKMFIVPAIVLGMALAGLTMRMTRTMMLEVLRQDYIRTAWAKGLRERVVIARHALKNALIPVITVVGLQLPIMIGGTVIIEQIFMLPGMGRLIIKATITRDYPLVSGIMLIFAVAIVILNLIVDLTYAYLDPRIQYK